MKYLLDTNVLSEVAKPAPEARCVEWLNANKDDCAVSSVTLAELRYGVERTPDGKRKRALERKLDFLQHGYSDTVLAFDESAAAEWGRYITRLERNYGSGVLEQLEYPDTQIAAIALAHGLVVVTNNDKDFPQVTTVNPYTT